VPFQVGLLAGHVAPAVFIVAETAKVATLPPVTVNNVDEAPVNLQSITFPQTT
jgi:hypothetical protein